jgi:hypothetical protein
LLGVPSIVAWRRLARASRGGAFTVDQTFRSISGQIPGSYGVVERCLRVEIGPSGVRISTWAFLQRLLPPLVISWADITSCTQERYYFSPLAARLEIAHRPQPLYLWANRWAGENLPQLIKARWLSARGECLEGGADFHH